MSTLWTDFDRFDYGRETAQPGLFLVDDEAQPALFPADGTGAELEEPLS